MIRFVLQDTVFETLNIAEEFDRLSEWVGRQPWARPVKETLIYRDTEEALERIDATSRKFFPLSFGIIMLTYWTSYLYIFEDEVYV